MNYLSVLCGNLKCLWNVITARGNKRKECNIAFPQAISADTKIRLKNGKLVFGKRIHTKKNVSFSVVTAGVLEIGKHTSFNKNCMIVCQNHISIGANCRFGPNVCIFDHDHVFDSNGIYGECKTGEIQIGQGCWIGTGAIILRNTVIGEGTVIGAGTVVKGVIPPHSLVKNDRTLRIEPIRD